MVEWGVAGLLSAYFGVSVLALYLQYRSHTNAMTKLAESHTQHTADLHVSLISLQADVDSLRREIEYLREERAS